MYTTSLYCTGALYTFSYTASTNQSSRLGGVMGEPCHDVVPDSLPEVNEIPAEMHPVFCANVVLLLVSHSRQDHLVEVPRGSGGASSEKPDSSFKALLYPF